MPDTIAEATETAPAATAQKRRRTTRYRGHGSQVFIYLGKLFRMFVFQNDWKVLPMAAVIAALVAMVMQYGFFVTKEGTMMGSFAFACVCIWNGCFNSIQVICRERSIVKREHRSGMHVFSYIAAHMIYQAFLCLCQTVLLIYVSQLVGVKYPSKGLFCDFFLLEYGVTIFLITYASDMLSLFISSFARNTTVSMTIMPFILIFQLVFSGGIFTLPEQAKPVARATVSSYGLKAINVEADYNHLPSVVAWNTLFNMRNNQMHFAVKNADLLRFLRSGILREQTKAAELLPGYTLADLIDALATDESAAEFRDVEIPFDFRIQDIIDVVGEDTLRNLILRETVTATQKPEYEATQTNLLVNWLWLALYALLFAFLSMVSLKFIDKDKR